MRQTQLSISPLLARLGALLCAMAVLPTLALILDLATTGGALTVPGETLLFYAGAGVLLWIPLRRLKR